MRIGFAGACRAGVGLEETGQRVRTHPGRAGHDEYPFRTVNASHDGRAGERRTGSTAYVDSLLATVDGLVRDAHVHARFGELGPAFSTALESWTRPLAAAIRGLEPTTHSQAAARAMTDLARLAGECAGQAIRSIPDLHAVGGRSGHGERYAELVGQVDDSFREFASRPDFDRARRSAASAILDWLERDRATAASIARALDASPAFATEHAGGSRPPDAAPILRDGNATLTAYPCSGSSRASVLVIPGFTIGARAFDLDPQRSFVRALAERNVHTWLLDWGRTDETDRARTVANQLERIDRAVDAVREASQGRRPALAGHFHGGLLALLYCIRRPHKAHALITVSTPVEFASNRDGFAAWLRACDGERLVDVLGNIPGPLVAALVAASSPMRWCGGGFLGLLGGLDSPSSAARIARFELARRFPPAFPGQTFRAFFRAFYLDNAFAAHGSAVIDGCRYELSRLETPLLNVFARDDRVVPPDASRPLGNRTGAAPGSNMECRGGHFDVLAGQETYDVLLPELAAWLAQHAPRS